MKIFYEKPSIVVQRFPKGFHSPSPSAETGRRNVEKRMERWFVSLIFLLSQIIRNGPDGPNFKII